MDAPALLLALLVAAASPASATDQTSSAGMSRTSESLETFVLQTNLQSNLFSTCAAEANSVSGSLYSIDMGTSEFVQVQLTSSSTQNITWVVKSGVKSTIDCAQATLDAGKLMFKYSGGTCSVAANGVYDPSQHSCTGETVYVLIPNPNACHTSLGAFGDGARITTDGNCTSSCAAGSVVSGAGTQLTGLPEKTLQCCPNNKSPCLYIGCESPPCDSSSTVRKEYFCDAVAFCAYHGLILIDLTTVAVEYPLYIINKLYPGLDINLIEYWINTRIINGSWVYFPSNTPVRPSSFAAIPVDDECMYYKVTGLATAPCNGEKRPVICADATKSLPVC